MNYLWHLSVGKKVSKQAKEPSIQVLGVKVKSNGESGSLIRLE